MTAAPHRGPPLRYSLRHAHDRLRPRRADETALYQVVAEQLETFLTRARERNRPPPRFVEREFRHFLKCGIFAHGFLRVHCDACGCDRLVPFSFKGRGFCNSCGGRRMAETATHLLDRVLPEAPVRQWVLSLPHGLRYRLAYDARMTSDVLRIFVRRVFASLRRRARLRLPIDDPQCGAVTLVQRFGGALNLNVHFHSLVLDGIYDARDGMRFRPLAPPDDDEVERVTRSIARGIARLLERRGLAPDADPEEVDPLRRIDAAGTRSPVRGTRKIRRERATPRRGASGRRVREKRTASDGVVPWLPPTRER